MHLPPFPSFQVLARTTLYCSLAGALCTVCSHKVSVALCCFCCMLTLGPWYPQVAAGIVLATPMHQEVRTGGLEGQGGVPGG